MLISREMTFTVTLKATRSIGPKDDAFEHADDERLIQLLEEAIASEVGTYCDYDEAFGTNGDKIEVSIYKQSQSDSFGEPPSSEIDGGKAHA